MRIDRTVREVEFFDAIGGAVAGIFQCESLARLDKSEDDGVDATARCEDRWAHQRPVNSTRSSTKETIIHDIIAGAFAPPIDIIARLPAQAIVARSAIEDIVAVAGIDRLITPTAGYRILARSARYGGIIGDIEGRAVQIGKRQRGRCDALQLGNRAQTRQTRCIGRRK